MRINKYLAHHGYASRREADRLIETGQVTINGKNAQLGDIVSDNDRVCVRGRSGLEQFTTLAFYKPRGIVTSSPQKNEVDILSSAPDIASIQNIAPIGRLDKDSEGLILLSNDRSLFDFFMKPDSAIEKEYVVTVQEAIRRDFEASIQNGVTIETDHGPYITKPCTVTVKNKNTFSITITEGKNRQIRRMCAALDYTVKSLKRVRIGTITLGSLRPNQSRILERGMLDY